MSIDSQADREMELLDEQLSWGSITQEEYNRSVRELERDVRDAYREAEERAVDEVREGGYW